MPDARQYRLRLKLPGGAEFEAEGDPEFILAERRAFLSEPAKNSEAPHWPNVLENKAGTLQLRGKLRPPNTEQEACLLLMAGASQLLQLTKPTAAQLARWLRASGYPVQRVDRAIMETVRNGQVLASGSRRARRYELTGPGRAKAFLLARELEALLENNPLAA